jgi:hypothetical protein
MVVNVMEKAVESCQVSIRKMNANEPLMTCRKPLDQSKTKLVKVVWDKLSENLFIGSILCGIEVA